MTTFDEDDFIYDFKIKCYKETDFDFDTSFDEYFRNFIENNSIEYNLIVLRYLYNKYRIKWSETELTLREYVYIKLYNNTKEKIMK